MKTFKKDIQRIQGGLLRKMLNISFWIILNYRASNFFYRNNLFAVSKLFWLANRIIFTVDIDPGSSLAGGLRLVHPMCIVVGREVISLGELTLYQSTTLGGSDNKQVIYNGKTIRQPYIYPNVIVYTSSVIVGPLIIGQNATIATNSTITKNVPADSVAFGINKIKSKINS